MSSGGLRGCSRFGTCATRICFRRAASGAFLHKAFLLIGVVLAGAALAACAQSSAPRGKFASSAISRQGAPAHSPSFGIASSYSEESQTASGERFNANGLTAAHRTLPFGTRVRVTNHSNGRSVVVTINDRGPFVSGRIIDVTPAAARALGMSGLAPVTIERE